jgi:hypothetical protein
LRRRSRAAAALALAALAAAVLSACETTQEKSARLEKIALRKKANAPLGASGLKITTPSRAIQVLEAVVLHASEGTAVAVRLRNRSGKAQYQVPLLIDVTGANGASVYSNSTPGLATSLVSAAYVPAHATVVWVNDQIQATAAPKAVQTKIGEGKPASGVPPKVEVTSSRLEHEPGGVAFVAGSVANRSGVDQHELVVTALADAGGRTVGAGRAVLALLPAGQTSKFQIFLVGEDPAGAKLLVGVSPSTLR